MEGDDLGLSVGLLFIMASVVFGAVFYRLIRKRTKGKSVNQVAFVSFVAGVALTFLLLYLHYEVTGKGILEYF